MKFLALSVARVEDWLDGLLDRLTTYRLVLYILIVYLVWSVGLAWQNQVPFTAQAIVASSLWLVLICRASNWLLASLFKVPRNYESDLITALILALIMTPGSTLHGYAVLAGTGFSAMLIKYVLTWKGRHIFNPAASGAFIAGWLLGTYASWWVGTKWMAPLIILGGFLIAKKMKRLQMVAVFGAVYAAYLVAYAPGEHLFSTVWEGLVVSPVIFFATVMLTEPLTSPTSLNQCLSYALVTGTLFSVSQLHFSPEEALLGGNALTFLMRPNRSLLLEFVGSRREAAEIYSFIFRPKNRFKFTAGQYMEWTLPGVRLDNRGNRRYLTMASSPTESGVAFSVRMPTPKSGFKTALTKLKPGDKILAAQIAGEFVLPKNTHTKLAFIAGGIGITPFRSMAKCLIDNKEHRDVHLIYSASEASQLAFKDLFQSARNVGLKTTYVDSASPGRPIQGGFIATTIPDYPQRVFYISGPQNFVAHIRQALLSMNVQPGNIVTDFFPGYN